MIITNTALNQCFFVIENSKKYFFNLCEDQIFSVPSDMGYTAPVDNLVHRVHQVPALHLFITRDGVTVSHTAPLSSCGMSHYSEVMAACRLSGGGFVAKDSAARRIVVHCITIMPKHIFQGTMRASSLNQQNSVLRLFSKVRKDYNNRTIGEMLLDKHLTKRW